MNNFSESMLGLSNGVYQNPWSVEALELEQVCYRLASKETIDLAIGAGAIWQSQYDITGESHNLLSALLTNNSMYISNVLDVTEFDFLSTVGCLSLSSRGRFFDSLVMSRVVEYIRDSIYRYVNSLADPSLRISSYLIEFSYCLDQYGLHEQSGEILNSLSGTTLSAPERKRLAKVRSLSARSMGHLDECVQELFSIILMDDESGTAPDLETIVTYCSVALRAGRPELLRNLVQQDNLVSSSDWISLRSIVLLISRFEQLFSTVPGNQQLMESQLLPWDVYADNSYITSSQFARTWFVGWHSLSQGDPDHAVTSFVALKSQNRHNPEIGRVSSLLADEGLAYVAASRGLISSACNHMLSALNANLAIDLWSDEHFVANAVALANWSVQASMVSAIEVICNARRRIQGGMWQNSQVVGSLYAAEGDLRFLSGEFVRSAALFAMAGNFIDHTQDEHWRARQFELKVKVLESQLAAGLINDHHELMSSLEVMELPAEAGRRDAEHWARLRVEGDVYFADSMDKAGNGIVDLVNAVSDLDDESIEWDTYRVLSQLRFADYLDALGEPSQAVDLLARIPLRRINDTLSLRVSISLHIFAGRNYRIIGSYSQASQEFTLARKACGDSPGDGSQKSLELSIQIAECLGLSGKFAECIRQYELLIQQAELNGESHCISIHEARFSYAQCLEQSRAHDRAADQYKIILDLAKYDSVIDLESQVNAWISYGWNLDLSGEPLKAVEAYQNALSHSSLLSGITRHDMNQVIRHRISCCSPSEGLEMNIARSTEGITSHGSETL